MADYGSSPSLSFPLLWNGDIDASISWYIPQEMLNAGLRTSHALSKSSPNDNNRIYKNRRFLISKAGELLSLSLNSTKGLKEYVYCPSPAS